ncbi:50S ribosomal protein L1 [Candidatus Saccharibacteria bacterium]|nr:50S ribosomal protein L1 [Candidatus Saccharibacteria bacterium]MCL1962832.1 50S ribosomal protein L1 [Candidatus Saccharibacteria bacterium]
MAKTKQELLNEADKMGLTLSVKNTVAEIETAIAEAEKSGVKTEHTEIAEPVVTEEKTEEKMETTETDEHFTKAGKHSHKAVEEAEKEAERQARKEAGDTTPQDGKIANDTKGPKPVCRKLIDRKGKNYKKLAEKLDRSKTYSLGEALALAIETSPVKFDATVEIHVRLGVDPKQADQNVRSTVSLPNGTGKTVRVAAFVAEADVEAVKKAGADVAGEADILKLLDKEEIAFDVLVATPQLMPKLGKYARLLGPRGLMPNPKAGTVSTNPAGAVKEAKAGKVEYRVDKQSIVHLGIGKVSFGAAKLEQNANVFITSLNSAKPSSIKGTYILSTAISTTMGPGIKVSL